MPKPWRKSFGIWVPDRSWRDERGFISPGLIGAVAGSRRRTAPAGGIVEDSNSNTSQVGYSTLLSWSHTQVGALTNGYALIVGQIRDGTAANITAATYAGVSGTLLVSANRNWSMRCYGVPLGTLASGSKTVTISHANSENFRGLVVVLSGVTQGTTFNTDNDANYTDTLTEVLTSTDADDLAYAVGMGQNATDVAISAPATQIFGGTIWALGKLAGSGSNISITTTRTAGDFCALGVALTPA